jgi:hypothetical protein
MASQSGLVSESESYYVQVFRGSRIPTIWRCGMAPNLKAPLPPSHLGLPRVERGLALEEPCPLRSLNELEHADLCHRVRALEQAGDERARIGLGRVEALLRDTAKLPPAARFARRDAAPSAELAHPVRVGRLGHRSALPSLACGKLRFLPTPSTERD